MTRDDAVPGARAARAVVVVVLLVALVVGLVVGAGVLLSRLLGPREVLARERCVAEVPVPDQEGDVYSAALAVDQAANAALVVGVAHQRGLPARAGTIGVATAIQESSLRNIDYGDRDSLGLFQQRPSQGWGSAEQVQDPLYATGAFYDALVEVPGWQELEVTVAAQRVQRSAFPEAYGQHEPQGRALASSFYGLAQGAFWCELRAVEEPGPDPAAAVAGLVAALEAAGPGGWSLASGSTEHDEGLVLLSVDGARDAERMRWAVGHTVVALAAAHDVVSVQAGSSVWQRERGAERWVALEEPADGGVVVRLARTEDG